MDVFNELYSLLWVLMSSRDYGRCLVDVHEIVRVKAFDVHLRV